MEQALAFLDAQSPILVYLVLGVGSALENIFPPLPADTFILLGGFLAGQGRATPWMVFVVTWLANVASALLVYRLGYHFGQPFFQTGLGRKLLNRAQLKKIGIFYDRWGLVAIFFTRFLPGLRATIPVFAGVTRQGFVPVALPVGVASAIWYGALVWLGVTARRNLDAIVRWVSETNEVLLGVALVLSLIIGVWWYRTRGSGEEE